jgi:arylsulfatase A-like enzyme
VKSFSAVCRGISVLFVVVGTACDSDDRGPVDPRPNVIVFVLDAARADHFGVYGYGRDTTPNIDAFAREATVFEAAYSEAAFTFVSVAAFMTGRLPATAQQLRPKPIPAVTTTLAERARRSGYRTLAYTENPYVSIELGFSQGFTQFEEGFDGLVYDDSEREAAEASRVRQAEGAIRRALDWMSEPGEPFFAYLHLLRPHNPYAPPPAFRGRFGVRPEIELLGYTENLFAIDAGTWKPAPEHVGMIVTLYDENLAYGDALFGRLWTGLRERGLEQRTMVIVTSDHGEAFGEHGRFLHGTTVYDEMVRIPMIVRYPARLIGRRSAAPVQLSDLTETLIDVFEEPDDPTTAEGRSLLPVLRTGQEPPGKVTFSWSGWEEKLCAVRRETSKLIVSVEGSEPKAVRWFDLASDPSEQRPLPVEGNSVAAELMEHLHVQRQRWGVAETGAETGSPIGPKTAERLKALGYVQD